MDQSFESTLEEHFNLGPIFQCRQDSTTERVMFQDVACLIPAAWRIGLCGSGIAGIQERLVTIGFGPGSSGDTRLTGSLSLICVMGLARVAAYSRRLLTNHSFDSVREHEFALATP